MKTYTKGEMEKIITDLLSENISIETIETPEGYNPRFYIKQSNHEVWENYRLSVGVSDDFIKMAVLDVVKKENFQLDEFTLAGRTNESYMAFIISGIVNKYMIEQLDRFRGKSI